MPDKTKKNKEEGKIKDRDLKPAKDTKGGGGGGTLGPDGTLGGGGTLGPGKGVTRPGQGNT